MGDRIQTIAKIIFALAFVAILAVMNSNILNLSTNANKKLNATISMTDSFELSMYEDGSVVTGDTVISAIKNAKTLSTTSKLYVSVVTSAGNTSTYGYVNGSYVSYNQTASASSDFINPNAEFESTLNKNANGVVVGITFVQK